MTAKLEVTVQNLDPTPIGYKPANLSMVMKDPTMDGTSWTLYCPDEIWRELLFRGMSKLTDEDYDEIINDPETYHR